MINNDFGNLPRLVEECQKVTASSVVSCIKSEFRKSLSKERIKVGGVEVQLLVSRTGNNGQRYWFACPSCNGRVGVLYRESLTNCLACRRCLNLGYRKQRQKGMVEAEVL